MKKALFLMLLVFAASGLMAQAANEENTLIVYAYDSFASDWGPAGTLIPKFEEETGIKVNLVSAGDAVEMISRVELEGEDTRADVILGITDDFAYRAYPYLESYDSLVLSDIPDELKFDPENRLIPFDYGAFAFVWDSECGLDKPESLSDLTKEEYKDKDHCPCRKACRYHGNCKECVAIHRAHQEHVPNCMRQMLNRKIRMLSELTEHSIASEIEPPKEVLRKEFQ